MPYDVPDFTVETLGPFPFCVPSMTTAEIDEHIGVGFEADGTPCGPWSGIKRGLTLREAWDWFWKVRGVVTTFSEGYEGEGETWEITFMGEAPPARVCAQLPQLLADPGQPDWAGVSLSTSSLIRLGYTGRASEVEYADGYYEPTDTYFGPIVLPVRDPLPPVVYDTSAGAYCLLFGFYFRTIGGIYRSNIGGPEDDSIYFGTLRFRTLFGEDTPVFLYTEEGNYFQDFGEVTHYTVTPT